MSSQESSNSRFQHLLQPIRDLSQNWNIDLAKELEEYLDDLEQVSIAFDGETETSQSSTNSSTLGLMNFAEAALLIQGSSLIYSRKVEYLYALVYQTLTHLTKQHVDQQQTVAKRRNRRDQGGVGDEDDEEAGTETNESNVDVFVNSLPTYETVEEARNITMSTTVRATVNSSISRSSNTNLQASIALMGSLVPDDHRDNHSDTFKLLSSQLHSSGVLLLDEISKDYLSTERRPALTRQSTTVLVQTPLSKVDFERVTHQVPSSDPVTVALDFSHTAEEDEDVGGLEYDFDGGDIPIEDITSEDIAAEPIQDLVDENSEFNKTHQQSHVTNTENDVQTTESEVTKRAPEEVDPWTPLDPYDASNSLVRPFRKGRTYPIKKSNRFKVTSKKQKKKKSLEEDDEEEKLLGVDDPAFQERFLGKSNQPQWSSWVWTDLVDDQQVMDRYRAHYCKSPFLLTTCTSLWQLERKWNMLMQKTVAKTVPSAQAVVLQEQVEETTHEIVDTANPLEDHIADDDEDDVDYGGIVDDDWGTENVEDGPTQSEPLDQNRNQSLSTVVEQTTSSYEEMCREHLAAFMKGTEQYVRETNLTRQVSAWQDQLRPILEAQEVQAPFDIHQYGNVILTRLQRDPQKKKKKPLMRFEQVVNGCDSYEVCRLFLASLQLANNGNVQLMHAANDQVNEYEVDQVPLEMELLTTTNVYESIQQSSHMVLA